MSLHNYTVPVLYVYKLHLLDYKLAGPRMYYTGDYVLRTYQVLHKVLSGMQYSVAIPPSNYSESIREAWFVISFIHVPAKNVKPFQPLLGEGEEKAAGKDTLYGETVLLIPPSNYRQSVRHVWFVISFTRVSAKNAKLFKPLP